MFGFLNIYKPKGKTSHDVVAILRRIAKVKQIGHTGTLDPFAEGVLPICTGKSTRLIEYLNDEKAYIGTIQLGNSTTTYDIEGDVVNTSEKSVTESEIEVELGTFRGEIKQLPPIYSAIKVNGKKLYEYARKGEAVNIEPRKVNIYKCDILKYDSESRQLELYIECSKGTSIRSIANDLGEKLGTFGHLIKLIRVKAGAFEILDSIKLEEFKTADDIEKHLINPLKKLDYPVFEINEREKQLISNGGKISLVSKDGITILTCNGSIVAIGKVLGGIFKPDKVFI